MPNFMAILINSIKNQESTKHLFMGEYGVVIAIFRKGVLNWVESTWGMGFAELKRAVMWGGGRCASKPVPLEDTHKKNVDLPPRELISTLLTWETEMLSLPSIQEQETTGLSFGLVEAIYNLTPGQCSSFEVPSGGPGILHAIKEISDSRFTGYLRLVGAHRGAFFLVGGRNVAGFVLTGESSFLLGKSALDWLAQQVGVQYEKIKCDLFTTACLVVPFLRHATGQINPDALEDFVNKTQADISGNYLLHLHMREAHAIGLIYRGVYVGTLARKKGEDRASLMPVAVLLRLAMLPGTQIDYYRYQVPAQK